MTSTLAAPILRVTDEQRATLRRLPRSLTPPHRTVVQAKTLLLCADGEAIYQAARRLEVGSNLVRRWRRHFERDGLDSVGVIAPGRGRKPSLPEGTVAQVVNLTLNSSPDDGSTQWSTRSLGRHLGISHDTVARIWKDHGLQPWKVDGFKVSTNPHFEEKLVDVVGLYTNQPERAIVFSFDEKTPVQVLDRIQPRLPMKKGRGSTMTPDYKRHGTTDLFAAMNIATGKVLYDTKDSHAAKDVLNFFKFIDLHVARDLEIHVVLDNLSAHKAELVRTWLEHPKRSR